MEILIVLGILIILIVIKNNKSSDDMPGIAKAYEDLQSLPTMEKNIAETYIDDLIEIVHSNIKYLPQEVLKIEYTKKAINAFLWYYVTENFFKKNNMKLGFIILTIVIDKLDKEGIIKHKDFDARIYKDERFILMLQMMPIFSGQPANRNTLILVFIEKYMESLTGQKVRYMNENTKEKEKRKTAGVNGIDTTNDSKLDMLDRPDKTEDYWEARNMTGSFLEERLKKHKGFSWIRVEPMFPKFDDMSFAYKNKIFSVLIDVGYSKNENLTTQEKDRFIKECTTHNLIPCIFPIKNKKTLLSLPDDEWNLYDIRTNELVNPLVVATDEKVMMSDYEFNNMAVSIVKDYIRKEKMKFESYCDIIGIYPQIWFKDEDDEMSWIYVIYSTNGKFSNVSKELDKLITGMPQFNGYIAQVGLACAEKDGPYRGAGFYIKFNGIEKIYSAHRDTGHGYGIEIKIK